VSLNPQRLIESVAVGAEAARPHRPVDALRQSAKSVCKPIRVCLGDSACWVRSINFGLECSDTLAALTKANRLEFVDDFRHEITRLKDWASELNWTPSTISELNVVVSDRCRISKSLVPAWSGSAGYMEFPAWRVASREAAIMHELIHVFFPSGNRFLAEGFAVCVQAAIGGNAAFPNFGMPLHQKVCERLLELKPSIFGDRPISLGHIHLSELDRIPTPNPLTLRVGDEIFAADPRGQAFLYTIAGSFVEFLIETYGIESFLAVYAQAPLVPLVRDAGSQDRWRNIYPGAFADLEKAWKSMILSGLGDIMRGTEPGDNSQPICAH
jgi:hypothetical protein